MFVTITEIHCCVEVTELSTNASYISRVCYKKCVLQLLDAMGTFIEMSLSVCLLLIRWDVVNCLSFTHSFECRLVFVFYSFIGMS